MFAYEPPLEPPCNYWEEYEKPAFILDKINEICADIVKFGEKTRYQNFLDVLYEQVEENIEKFLPEADYGECD
jgi:hypothetical protein